MDLIGVLIELFDLTLLPNKALTTIWQELQDAFETYERSPSRQQIHHNGICSRSAPGEQIMAAGHLGEEVRDLVMKYLQSGDGSRLQLST